MDSSQSRGDIGTEKAVIGWESVWAAAVLFDAICPTTKAAENQRFAPCKGWKNGSLAPGKQDIAGGQGSCSQKEEFLY